MDLYEFLLDFFPLTDVVQEQNRILGERLQLLGVELLLGEHPAQHLKQLDLLLCLSHDLGYIEHEVLQYLQKGLRKVKE
jgi:hypothetical protein